MILVNESYYDSIMGHDSKSFITLFNNSWEKCLSEVNPKYSRSSQMKLGHRLRPLLASWGYCLPHLEAESLNFHNVADIAVSIELIHKASIIADDLIDGDIARHGKPAFHVEHSDYEAILFVVHLLGLSVKTLNNSFIDISSNSSQLKRFIHLVSGTICDMSVGALKELNLGKSGITEIQELHEIINLETIGLIKNSFLLGYLVNGNSEQSVADLVESIGYKCGFVFQLLNDAEPFSQQHKNNAYKGNMNFDLNKSRKNIIIGYLYGMANTKEKLAIQNAALTNSQHIVELYDKYNMTTFVINEVTYIKSDINTDIIKLCELTKNSVWAKEFETFIDYLFDYCMKRLSD